MKKIFLYLSLVLGTLASYGQGGTWTWMKGDTTWGVHIGTIGVPDSNDYPPGRALSAQWKDLDGNLWIFGGGYHGAHEVNSLWKFDVHTNIWTWMKGIDTVGNRGVYGTMGVPDPQNTPGARGSGMATWVDKQGHLWLFGGEGYGQNGYYGELDELWMYDIPSNQWTFVKGRTTTSVFPVYGTLRVDSSINDPGPRYFIGGSWTGSDSTLWFFGGQAFGGPCNDLWKFDIRTNHWTWMSGRQSPNYSYSYGTKNLESASNLPPARWSAAHWQDDQGYFYMFGGSDNQPLTFRDVWRYNTHNDRWTWISGYEYYNNTSHQPRLCGPADTLAPDRRTWFGGAQINACSSSCWVFGGFTNSNFINDLWKFDLYTQQWTWVSGSDTFSPTGHYGSMGVPSAANVPSGRYAGCTWVDDRGYIWTWSGAGRSIYSEMWRFIPDTSCLHSSLSNVPYAEGSTSRSVCLGDTSVITIRNTNIRYILPDSSGTILDSAHIALYPSIATTYCIGTDFTCGHGDTMLITIVPVTAITTALTATLYCGDSISFQGHMIHLAGTYIDTLTAMRGCDSIITLSVSAPPHDSSSRSAIICQGSSYPFGTRQLSDAGIYYDTLTNVRGCDSIISLYLLVDTSAPQPTIRRENDSIYIVATQAAHLQWQYNNVNMPGQTGPYIIITQDGLYSLIATDNNGCGNTVSLPVVNLGIQDQPADDLSITYDPAAQLIRASVTNSKTENYTLRLIDMLGREVSSYQLQLGVASIPASGYPAGAYLVVATSTTGVIVKRVVIK